MASDAPLLRVRDLTAGFAGPDAVVEPVLDGVSFDLWAGRALAIVGDSGSGKSLIGLSIMRLPPREARLLSGRVELAGVELLALPESEMRKLRGRRLAMIFQEPSTALSPVHTVGWQLSLALRAGAITGRRRGLRGLRPRALELMERVELPDPKSVLESYPHQLSVGMRQRVLIAMALACDPQLIIADEPTTGLDAPIQAQILDLFRRLLLDGERSVIFITNDLGVVAEAATDVAILYRGQIVELAPVKNLLAAPQHPYTQALLSSLPRLDRSTAERERDGASWKPSRLSVLPPAEHELAGQGCRFSPRCPRHRSAPERFPRCLSDRPELDPPQARHRARCFYPSLSPEVP